tara:strand:+ start:394 stop:915 length:522 start_codon:yes stop_codon:yes gene_type:complete
MIKIIKDVLTLEDCFSLYNGLIQSNMWNLVKSSGDIEARSFAGVDFIRGGETNHNNPYWMGYFNCLFDRINQKLKEQHNFSLKRKIRRIGLNAQNHNHYTEFHVDGDFNSYSIIGFLTPQWAEDWGGELNIEGEVTKYNPGDFILFNSSQMHTSQKIKPIPYYRVTVSYVIDK